MGHGEGVKFTFLPPHPFITGCVVLLMVNSAKRNSELITHLEAKPFGLGEADVMSVCRRSPANETGLLGYKAQMLLGPVSLWFADGEHALVNL